VGRGGGEGLENRKSVTLSARSRPAGGSGRGGSIVSVARQYSRVLRKYLYVGNRRTIPESIRRPVISRYVSIVAFRYVYSIAAASRNRCLIVVSCHLHVG